jgi:putative transcriptional regulator
MKKIKTFIMKYLKLNRIKIILKEQGKSQKWLAEKMGKSYNMINSYVQNRRQPSLIDLFKIARLLNELPTHLINNMYDVHIFSEFDKIRDTAHGF